MAKSIHVFVSWSGKKSKPLGNHLAQWLPSIIPSAKVFVSTDLSPGVEWIKKVSAAIGKNQFAILCVTRGNLNAAWLNFEAGALWKAKSAKTGAYVCPLLLDLPPGRLRGPLAMFQAKRFVKRDFKDICKFLAGKTGIPPHLLENNFRAVWPQLEKAVKHDLRRAGGRKAQRRNRRRRRAQRR